MDVPAPPRGGGGGGGPCCRSRKMLVGLLLSMNLFEAMNGTLTGLLIPVISESFGCTTEVAAWMQLGPQFAAAMLGPPIGMVADTIGRTTVWRLFAGILMLMMPFCGFATSVYGLIIARTIGGTSWAGCGPAGFAIMAQVMSFCCCWWCWWCWCWWCWWCWWLAGGWLLADEDAGCV